MMRFTMKNNQGFTLIELMIAVAIVGILASIAYPSYQQSIMQSHRVDAQASLVNLANIMEQQFTQTGSYQSVTPPPSSTYYTISITATDTTYLLSAVPNPGSAQANDACGTLNLDNFGQKSAAMNSGCW